MGLRKKAEAAKPKAKENATVKSTEPVSEPVAPLDPRRFLNTRDRKAAEQADERDRKHRERKAEARS